MGHSHDHACHQQAPEQVNLAFAIAVLLNLGFTALEAIYAISADSMSLLGDAAHNLGDVLGLMLAWGANWLLSKPSNVRYSYGYKRTTIIAALINALIIVGTGFIIAYEAVIKLLDPAPTNEVTVIVVAAIGIAINAGTAMLFIRGSKEDLNIKGAFLHLAVDAIISLGVVFTGIIIYYTKWYWLDGVIALLIVLAIVYGTWELLRDSVLLLLDGVPTSLDYSTVKQSLMDIQGVTSVHDLHIWGLSTKEIALTAHLVMPGRTLTDHDYSKINQMLKTNFKIKHVTLQVEQGYDSIQCDQLDRCH